MEIIDTVTADSLGPGDQVIIDGDPIAVTFVDRDREDIDEVLVVGWSYESGDQVKYPLYADDTYDIWAV